MGDVLAIPEQRDGKIRPVANEVVTVAAAVAEGLGGTAHALLLGEAGVGDNAADLGNPAEVVRVAEDPALEGYLPETHAAVIVEEVSSHGYAAVLFAATALGKDAPRVAALVDAPLASCGSAVVSLRPNAFGTKESKADGRTELFTVAIPDGVRTRIVDFQAAQIGTVDVSEASVIVSGGRGTKGAEHWNLLEDLRSALGPGCVGCFAGRRGRGMAASQ